MKLFKLILDDLLSLLFPSLCCGCGTPLFHGEAIICSRCRYHLPYTDHHVHPENIAARQFWGRLPCQTVMSLLYFKKGGRTQNLIHHLKYKGRNDLGIELGELIGEKLLLNPDYCKFDLIIPVPLHPARERKRGYNQSMSIAEGIASALKVPVDNTCLLRKKRTLTQTKKDRSNRFENMLSAFSIPNNESIRGKHILLVDDVMTTGATLEACGIVLFEGKISKLSIATIAFSR